MIIFTHVGRVIAFLLVLGGILLICFGLLIATEIIGPYEAALVRYFPSYASTGEMIDRGVYIAIIGTALGILTDISYGVND